MDSIEDIVSHISLSGQVVHQWLESDKNGSVRFADLLAFGDTTHTLIQRNDYPKDLFLPGWTLSPLKLPLKQSIWSKLEPIDLEFIDHVAANQPTGSMANIAKWY